MALALPLSILDTSGTAKSIARFTDGNATAPKSLTTLGSSEGNTPPVLMSDWVGCVESTTASLTQYCQSGSFAGSGNFIRCACLVQDPSLGLTQSWCACWCWCLRVAEDGGCGAASFHLRRNGTITHTCSLFSGNPTVCNGTFSNLIQDGTTVCVLACSCAGVGSYEAVGMSCIRLYCSFANTDGTVVIGTPSVMNAYSVEFL